MAFGKGHPALELGSTLGCPGQLTFARNRHDVNQVERFAKGARSPGNIELHFIKSNGLQFLQGLIGPYHLVGGIAKNGDADIRWMRRLRKQLRCSQ